MYMHTNKLEVLPTEVLTMILPQLEGSDVLNWLVLNKTFYKISLPLIYHRFKLPNQRFDVNLIKKYGKYIRELDINTSNYNPEIYLFLETLMNELPTRTFYVCCKDVYFYSLLRPIFNQRFITKELLFGQCAASLFEFGNHYKLLEEGNCLKKVRKIDIEVQEYLPINLFNLLSKSIQSVNINIFTRIDNYALVNCLSKFHSLKFLQLSLYDADKEVIQTLLNYKFPKLVDLNLCITQSTLPTDTSNELWMDGDNYPILRCMDINLSQFKVNFKNKFVYVSDFYLFKQDFDNYELNLTLFPSLNQLELNCKIQYQNNFFSPFNITSDVQKEVHYYNECLLSRNQPDHLFLKQLRKVKISGANIHPQFLYYLSLYCHNLKSLELNFCQLYEQEELPNIQLTEPKFNINTLVFKLAKSNESYLKKLVSYCNQLNTLILFTGWGDIDCDFKQILKEYPSLNVVYKRF